MHSADEYISAPTAPEQEGDAQFDSIEDSIEAFGISTLINVFHSQNLGGSMSTGERATR